MQGFTVNLYVGAEKIDNFNNPVEAESVKSFFCYTPRQAAKKVLELREENEGVVTVKT